MMKRVLQSILLTACFLFFIIPVFAANFPKTQGYVNDFAHLYSGEFRAKLEDNLSTFEKKTGTEIAVVTITSLDSTDIETYSADLFRAWGIGKRGKDNGLLLLISKNDRKIRIEVGYGIEPYVTDGRAGEIIRNQMTPEFKKENYEGGTQGAAQQLEKYIEDKDVAPKDSLKPAANDESFSLIAGFVIVAYLLITYVAGYLGRTKEIWPGGALGAVLGAIGGFFAAAMIGLLAGALLFGVFGLLLDYILTKNYKIRKDKGLPTGFFSTWGGFGGGGSGGGGFGGFGGGSSGGGGASGGW